MTQIGNVIEVNAVKEHLCKMKESGLIAHWELPFDRLLTRLTAAIFYISPEDGTDEEEIWKALAIHERLHYQLNEDHKLSTLKWRVEFNQGFDL